MLKKHFITIIKIAVSSVLIIIIANKLGIQKIINQLQATDPWWVLFAILIFTISNILGSFQWFLLLKARGINLSFLHVLAYYYVGLFFNNFLIGYIGGDAVRIYDITKRSGDSSAAISTVFLDRFMGFVMLTTLALVAGLIWQNMLESKTILIMVVVIFITWILSFLFLFNDKLAHNLGKVIRLIFSPKVNGKIQEIYKNINSFKYAKKTLSIIIIISLIIQIFRILVHYFAALSVGLRGHLKYFFLFIPIIALLASLPISIGGIGIREGSGVALFSNITSFQAERIVAMELLAYLIGLLSALPGGIVFMVRKEQIHFK